MIENRTTMSLFSLIKVNIEVKYPLMLIRMDLYITGLDIIYDSRDLYYYTRLQKQLDSISSAIIEKY